MVDTESSARQMVGGLLLDRQYRLQMVHRRVLGRLPGRSIRQISKDLWTQEET